MRKRSFLNLNITIRPIRLSLRKRPLAENVHNLFKEKGTVTLGVSRSQCVDDACGYEPS